MVLEIRPTRIQQIAETIRARMRLDWALRAKVALMPNMKDPNDFIARLMAEPESISLDQGVVSAKGLTKKQYMKSAKTLWEKKQAAKKAAVEQPAVEGMPQPRDLKDALRQEEGMV